MQVSVCVCAHVFEKCVWQFQRYTERKGENQYLMSHLLQKLCILMITQPLTLTLVMARTRHEVKYFLWSIVTLKLANHVTICFSLALVETPMWAEVFVCNNNNDK